MGLAIYSLLLAALFILSCYLLPHPRSRMEPTERSVGISFGMDQAGWYHVWIVVEHRPTRAIHRVQFAICKNEREFEKLLDWSIPFFIDSEVAK